MSGWILKDQDELNFIENIVKEISAKLSQTCSQLKELHSKLNIRQDDVERTGLEARDFFHKKIDEDTSLSCNSSSAEEDPTEHGEICHVKSEGEIIPPNSEASLEIGEKQINQHGDPSCGKDIEPDQDECREDLEAEQELASTTTLVGDAAKICMEEIWAYMMGDGVSKIGVWGMAGVGKTAIMKKVNNQLLEETEKFNIVIWITISKEMNISKVQKSIADAMKVDLPKAEDEAIRARFIYKKLSQKGKYVLILDDLWDKLSLEEVGIPEPCNGSKLVVTTRLFDVCRYLGCRVVRMSTEPDPCRLLRKTEGKDVLNHPDLLPIEESVAAEYDAKRTGKFQDSLVVDDLGRIGQKQSTTTLVGDAAKICIEEIWAYLMDDGVSKIGVWGMGGLGKTAVMKHVQNQLLKETEKFNIVIWITVSKEMNIFKIQNSIAKAMQESLPEVEDEAIRAGVLNEMLSQKGKYVLILDDLWDKLSLEEVGIPEPSNGSKLLVTSRLLEVCRYLGCQEVRMGILSKPEAWSLFSQKVGQDVLNEPQLLPIVESVAEECAGLPLAIVTIASSMKGERDIHEWRNALHELITHEESVSGLEGKVFQQLQFSYDRLHDQKLKHCFLCCALYPEDLEIGAFELIDLWVAEGLVEEMDSRQLEVDKGRAILNQLKDSCLIENGTKYPDTVKMHDILRDMALRITSTGPRFLVRAGLRLKEMPKVQEWKEDLEKVSLMLNYELQIPSQMPPPRCQKLTTLLLSYCGMKSIPECFFEQMHGLKILDLSSNPWIKSLPNSISNLETLTTLLLGDCHDLRKVPSFSKLQALKKLDLRNTKIEDLPHGLERLVNLKYLDLIGTSITEIADGILSNFTSLQHLAILNFDEATGKFVGGEVNRFVRGEEIGRLRKLEYFAGGFYDLNEWNNYIKALHAPTEGPRQYYIFAGEAPFFIFPSESKKVIQLNSRNICTDGIKVLPDVEGLGIGECIVDLCEEEAFSSRFILPPHNVFSSLSDLYISDCKTIKKLFSSNWVLQNLQNLKCLTVKHCEDMEEIIAPESESEEEVISAINFTLPKLKELRLGWLPKLKSICSATGVMVCDSIEKITITHCPKLKRLPLYLPLHDDGQPSPPPSLRKISIFPLQGHLVEWDQPNAESLLKPYFNWR